MRKRTSKSLPQYHLDDRGRFVVRDYNHAKSFSNFFPGIAGLWGIPMWAFYVNRGQCISSFGVESKDKAILEFQAANKAYRLTSTQGFRTFFKIKSGAKTIFYEPFQNHLNSKPFECEQTMSISSHDLTIEDINHTLGIITRVNYFTLPEEPFAGLVRRITIENISRKKYQIELIDGLPAIVPFGLTDTLLKNIPRTAEAWVKVNNLKNKAPYYHLKVVVSDKPEVTHILQGNFYFGFEASGKKGALLEPIADPECVFGYCYDFSFPETFVNQPNFKVPKEQQVRNRTPSAMGYAKCTLNPKAKKEFTALFGYAEDEKQLGRIVRQVSGRGFIAQKARRNEEIIGGVKNFALTASASKEFDLYTQQTFLDNILRGGLPVSLKTPHGATTFHVYSRKHGDPERDYNYFVLSPTYFSQGNGNYRDVNQNRRSDIWFNPDVRDGNILTFCNLIQPDGFNPLIVKGATFFIYNPQDIAALIKECVREDNQGRLRAALEKGFQPGTLLKITEQPDVKLKVSAVEFLAKAMGLAHKQEMAEHGEGFWSDHWTYNLDIIESYLSVYPEKLFDLMLGRKAFSFYHSSFYILPRAERYVLTDHGVRQYESVKNGSKEIMADEKGNKLRTDNGDGDIYYTHLAAKLLCLVANKVASLDPSGIGVEMEADKPNWYDALNGLPGRLGSSINETFELKRLALFLLDFLQKSNVASDYRIMLFEELAGFILDLDELLASDADALSYWDRSNDLKEQYRLSIRLGVSGKEKNISIEQIKRFLSRVLEKTNRAVAAARDNGLYHTYFMHEVAEYEELPSETGSHLSYVKPLRFKKQVLPFFLEGFVHALRVERDKEEARRIYQGVRKSDIFDKKLKMYKVNADLSGESEDIGRTRIFPAGWLENESIWLHMEYKFLLELLRKELYEEFYENFRQTMVPFMDPKRYGRSILENSSFVVSSAHKDSPLHGQGFVARLSGSTAEFLHIWLLMNAGANPFFLNPQGELNLRFRPGLPGWLFSKTEQAVSFYEGNDERQIRLPKNTYAFKFLNSILVVYHNPARKNTFGKNNARIKKIQLVYPQVKQPVVIASDTISSNYARDIRNGKLGRIDIFLE